MHHGGMEETGRMPGLKMSLDAVVGYISQVVIYVLFSGTTADGRLQAAQERLQAIRRLRPAVRRHSPRIPHNLG